MVYGRIQGFLLATISFCSITSFAMTQYSIRIDSLQKEFQDASSIQKIIYIDRDRLTLAIAKEDASADEEKRAKIAQEFVHKTLGVSLSDNDADTIADYLFASINVAVPLKGSGTPLCAVFPSDPNLNSKQEVERILYWDLMKDTEEYKNKKIKKFLTKEELAFLADLHETFHCLDEIYLPMASSYDPKMSLVEISHRAESFAEVGALIYLAQQGHVNLLDTRLHYRMVGSFMIARHKDLLQTLVDPENFSGAIYSFYPALAELQKMMNAGLPKMSLSQIVDLAHNIVNEKAFNSLDFSAIDNFHSDPASQQKLIEDFLSGEESLLKERFVAIKASLLSYKEVLESSFEQLIGDANQEAEGSPPMGSKPEASEPACEDLLPLKTEARYFEALEKLRTEHYLNEHVDTSLFASIKKLPSCMARVGETTPVLN